MRLSTKGRYAVMAMADLAKNGRGESGEIRAVSLAEIAARQEISLSYLEQLFARLRKSELVKSVRGPGGGYHLARSPQAISIADVIIAVTAKRPFVVRRMVGHPYRFARRAAEPGCPWPDASGRLCQPTVTVSIPTRLVN